MIHVFRPFVLIVFCCIITCLNGYRGSDQTDVPDSLYKLCLYKMLLVSQND